MARVRTKLADGGLEHLYPPALRRFEGKDAYSVADWEEIVMLCEATAYELERLIKTPVHVRCYGDLHLLCDAGHRIVLEL